MSGSVIAVTLGRLRALLQMSRRRRCVVLVAVLLLFCVYAWTIKRWGTVNPLSVMLHTCSNNDKSILPPPAPWKPSFRVVFSLTTMPHHLDRLIPTLKSLVNQDLPVDAVYLNVPYVARRSGKRYDIPAEVYEFVRVNQVVKINRCEDVGPLTKLAPTLLNETDPETLIITVDDDKAYKRDTSAVLAFYAQHHPDEAFSSCGWGMQSFPGDIRIVSVYLLFAQRGSRGTYVDILQAVCGNTYRRGFFDYSSLTDIPKYCFTVDDVWIAGYLQHRRTKRMILPYRLDPADAWSHKGMTFMLSSYNDENNIHGKCVESVEQKYRRKWARVSEYRRDSNGTCQPPPPNYNRTQNPMKNSPHQYERRT